MSDPTSSRVWGSRFQLGATLKDYHDVAHGNADGLWDNESLPAGTPVGRFKRGATLSNLRSLADGFSRKETIQTLSTYRGQLENRWGVTSALTPPAGSSAKAIRRELDAPELFATQKALALARVKRHPETVVDRFVDARGTVDGETIAPRKIFTQHFLPTAEPSGSIIVVAPGYLETGRNFYDQAMAWNAAGHDVLIMDQQWAGQSDGSPGEIDRAFGIARDVAAVTAQAAQIVQAAYGPDAKVVVYGNSMGGGSGAVGSYFLNLNDKITLEGPQMPKDVMVAAQSLYLSSTPGPYNRVLGWLSLGGINNIELPMVENLVRLTDDPVAEQLASQGGVREAVKQRPTTFDRVRADIAVIKDLIENGKKPTTQIRAVHANQDRLANFEEAKWLEDTLSSEFFQLVEVPSKNHVLEQSPTEMHYAIEAVNALLNEQP